MVSGANRPEELSSFIIGTHLSYESFRSVAGTCLVSLPTCIIQISRAGVPRSYLETKEPGSKLGVFELE